MQRVLIPATAGNVVVNALTVPAGHKYEVLETFIGTGGGGPNTAYVAVATAAGLVGISTQGGLASGAIHRVTSNALLLLVGDVMQLGVFKAGANAWTALIVYMDVTL